jgi:hypothetical protein
VRKRGSTVSTLRCGKRTAVWRPSNRLRPKAEAVIPRQSMAPSCFIDFTRTVRRRFVAIDLLAQRSAPTYVACAKRIFPMTFLHHQSEEWRFAARRDAIRDGAKCVCDEL